MGTSFIKVISVAHVCRKGLLIPQDGDKFYLHTSGLTDIWKQLPFLRGDGAGWPNE